MAQVTGRLPSLHGMYSTATPWLGALHSSWRVAKPGWASPQRYKQPAPLSQPVIPRRWPAAGGANSVQESLNLKLNSWSLLHELESFVFRNSRLSQHAEDQLFLLAGKLRIMPRRGSGCGRSRKPAALAGFPSEVEKSALGLFHGAPYSTALFTHRYCYRAFNWMPLVRLVRDRHRHLKSVP
jgi:hypothetical protein